MSNSLKKVVELYLVFLMLFYVIPCGVSTRSEQIEKLFLDWRCNILEHFSATQTYGLVAGGLAPSLACVTRLTPPLLVGPPLTFSSHVSLVLSFSGSNMGFEKVKCVWQNKTSSVFITPKNLRNANTIKEKDLTLYNVVYGRKIMRQYGGIANLKKGCWARKNFSSIMWELCRESL